LHDALADFLIELGSNGVIADEEIIDPPSGKVKADRESQSGQGRLQTHQRLPEKR